MANDMPDDQGARHVALLALLYTLQVEPQAAFTTVVSISPDSTDSHGRCDPSDGINVQIFQRMAPELTTAGRLAILIALRAETAEMIAELKRELEGSALEPMGNARPPNARQGVRRLGRFTNGLNVSHSQYTN